MKSVNLTPKQKKIFDFITSFYDKEGYIVYLRLSPTTTIMVNTKLAAREQIQSYKDLLNPHWKGKIAWVDPTQPGSGFQYFGVIGEKIMGYDFMR